MFDISPSTSMIPPASLPRAKEIDADFGHLDILVNNAGIAVARVTACLPVAVSMQSSGTFRVNFLGNVAVTQAMLPLLRKASSASIVNVSSGLGSLTKSGDPAWTHVAAKYLGYAASKAALNMLTVQLAYELRGHGDQSEFSRPRLHRNRSQPTSGDAVHSRRERRRSFAWRCSPIMVPPGPSRTRKASFPGRTASRRKL